MSAFGLEETGDHASAEKIARRSLALVPDNAAAVHVVAHVLEMQGRAQEGVAWLESTRSIWSRNAGFALHVAWHLALFHLARDDGRREVARRWHRKRLSGMRAFNLVHAVLAFAAARRDHRARAVVDLMRRDPATIRANTSEDLDLAVPVGEALVAFARDDYPRALERLARVREVAEHCGGSVAQCDLILLTYVEAALRGRRARLAQGLAAERTARRPGSRLNRWLFTRAGAAASNG